METHGGETASGGSPISISTLGTGPFLLLQHGDEEVKHSADYSTVRGLAKAYIDQRGVLPEKCCEYPSPYVPCTKYWC